MKCIKKQIIITATAVFIGNVSLAQTVPPVVLGSQMDVDRFSATTVTGRLTIEGPDITNITSLDGLTSIGGQLIIRANPNLTSLEGLEGLKTVNQLFISNNSKLTNLSGLDNLTHATNIVVIDTNSTLTSLEGLEKLTTIGVFGLSIYSNAVLSTLNGLNNLTALGGGISIGTSNGIVSSPNDFLTNFCAISQLVTGTSPQVITSDYIVVNNAYNPTHARLGNSETCVNTIRSGSLTLSTQIDIDNFTSTPFTGIAINLTINDATDGNITSLSGLTNITSIGGNLAVLENMALTSLEGLGNLATLGGKLQIGATEGIAGSLMPNAALTDFCAISQLVSGTPPQVVVGKCFVANNAYNPTYMGLASGIMESAAGENDGCAKLGMAVVSTNTFSKEEDDYRLFPNPVSDVLFVESESKITSITISNVSGQEVLKSNRASINVRNLSKGIYFARIVSGEKTVVEKFVKL